MKQWQKRTLLALLLANAVALVALVALMLGARKGPQTTLAASPLSPGRVHNCRQATISRLLRAGLNAIVRAHESGTVEVQIQRAVILDDIRPDADAAVWAALQAVVQNGACFDFTSVHVSVVYSDHRSATLRGNAIEHQPVPSTLIKRQAMSEDTRFIARIPFHATARAGLQDLILWSEGAIDDSELAQRIDYVPPLIAPAMEPDSTAVP